ncbi:MAG: phenylalanine--tRNA ligase subunit beta [Chloroflexi bacterium]|nr:phenylalanine--tRNA ligase subunit beta [Chloroflexota bacterium]
MKVPVSWLREYVDVTLPVDELAELLTIAGLEVSRVERIGEEWLRDKVFVGQILEIRRHPDADRLVLATVEYGSAAPLTVVTGAPNLPVGTSGQKVAFATIGARLIDGYSEELRYKTLKPTKIRGIRSEGMVLSEKELGLSDDHSGIIILDDDAPVGMPLADWLGDAVLHLDLTPNLARCFGIIGVAREVAALTDQPLRLTDPQMVATDAPISGQVGIVIEDPDLCSRYSATLIRGVSTGPSPQWMRRRLLQCGVRSINNLVDITNYVMLEWNQPLHAFDYDKLVARADGQAPTIIVRRAQPGEKIVTLDDVERTLDEDMLLITDTAGPIAVAGVMGGADTEIDDQTQNILLESANFNFINIRRTAKLLKLPSEASRRFGKGLHPSSTLPAVRRASQLMAEWGGGTIAQGEADNYPRPVPAVTINLTTREVQRLLGMDFSEAQIRAYLERLQFRVETDATDRSLVVTVPDHRLDVAGPADLVEEIARVHGYGRIPLTLMSDTLPPQHSNRELVLEEQIRNILVGCGLQEMISYALTSPQREEALALHEPDEDVPYVRLANPISSERTVMRRTLMAGALDTLQSNLRFRDRAFLFEIGRVYLPQTNQRLPLEERRLVVVITGTRHEQGWMDTDEDGVSFYDLKGMIETLLQHLKLETGVEFRPQRARPFHPGRSAQLSVGGEALGAFGELHPLVRQAFDLPDQPVFLADLNLDKLQRLVPEAFYLEPVPRFPAVEQDLAVVVAEGVPAQEVEDTIRAAGGRLLANISLFDIYRGEQIPPGKKSLAFSLRYQAADRTLTDREVAKVQARIVRRLQSALGAELRGA